MITSKGIIEQVAEFYGIDADDLLNGGKSPRFAEPRHIAIYLCRTMLGMGQGEVAAEFGRDRVLVDYAEKKVNGWLELPKSNIKAVEYVTQMRQKK